MRAVFPTAAVLVAAVACQRGAAPQSVRSAPAPAAEQVTTPPKAVAPKAAGLASWLYEVTADGGISARFLDKDVAGERARLAAIAGSYAGPTKVWHVRATVDKALNVGLVQDALTRATDDLRLLSGGRLAPDLQTTTGPAAESSDAPDSAVEIRATAAGEAGGTRTDAKTILIAIEPTALPPDVDELAEVVLRELLQQVTKLRDGVMAQKGLPTLEAAKALGWRHMQQHGDWWSWYRDFADVYVSPATWERLGEARAETTFASGFLEAPAAMQIGVEPGASRVRINGQDVGAAAGLAAGWNEIEVAGAPVTLTRFGVPLQGVHFETLLPDGGVTVAAVDPALVATGFPTYSWKDVRLDAWRTLPVVTVPMLRALLHLPKLDLKHADAEVFFVTESTPKTEVDAVGTHALDNGLYFGQESLAVLPVTVEGTAQHLVLMRPEMADVFSAKGLRPLTDRLIGYVTLPGRVLLVGLVKLDGISSERELLP